MLICCAFIVSKLFFVFPPHFYSYNPPLNVSPRLLTRTQTRNKLAFRRCDNHNPPYIGPAPFRQRSKPGRKQKFRPGRKHNIRPNIIEVYLTHSLIHVNLLCIHSFKTIFRICPLTSIPIPPTKCLAPFSCLEANPAQTCFSEMRQP